MPNSESDIIDDKLKSLIKLILRVDRNIEERFVNDWSKHDLFQSNTDIQQERTIACTCK